MLAISTTILFLGLYIPTASTTPIVADSSSLAPRTIPFNNLCPGGGNGWSRRECVPSVMKTQWRDVCGPAYIYSSCPEFNLCEDIVDTEGDRSIKCVPINDEGTTSPRVTEADPQIGTSDKRTAADDMTVTDFDFTVTIANDMSASVAAVFLSDDHTWLVGTKYFIGTVQSQGKKDVIICEGSSECYPILNYGLKTGDKIYFSWGLTDGQQGSLAYTIWPST